MEVKECTYREGNLELFRMYHIAGHSAFCSIIIQKNILQHNNTEEEEEEQEEVTIRTVHR